MFKGWLKKIVDRLIWHSVKKYSTIGPRPIKLVWENAAEQSARFIEEHADKAMLFHEAHQLWDFSLKQAASTGLYIECGVFDGTSLNYFAKKKPAAKFYGFDSFEGLEEDWAGHYKIKGAFDMKGKLPKVEENVELIKGWVSDTYAKFLSEKNQEISFLHIDTDTYSPALTILNASKPYLKEGSIILFDELHGYPNWKNGEFKALQETMKESDYEYIGFSNVQAAIKIKAKTL